MSQLLEIRNLKKYFSTKQGLLHAVENVSFSVEKGTTLGVVGESGCGKSTLGRAIIGLSDVTEGQIFYKDEDITHVGRRERKQLRRQMQIIFQDPYASLNPRMSVSEIIAEPLKIYQLCESRQQLQTRVAELMDQVGLDQRFAWSYPHELDGGRRQRIGIARALALDPEFIVCDEPVSALDVSVQAQILNLLQDLQESLGLTYLFITHDLSVVKHISTDIMVMYLGCLVEKCSADELFERQYHPYTVGLLSAIPEPVIRREKTDRILLSGEITSPIEPADQCRFAPRCRFCTEQCLRAMPSLQELTPGHFVACHRAQELKDRMKAEVE